MTNQVTSARISGCKQAEFAAIAESYLATLIGGDGDALVKTVGTGATIDDQHCGRAAGAEAMPSVAFYGRLLTNLPLMAAFCYFALIAGALIGIQNFSVPALVELYDVPLYLAAAGLTAYLGGSAAGILTGGELADRFPRHARWSR